MKRCHGCRVALLGLIALLFPWRLEALQRQHSTFQYGDIIAGGQTPSQIIARGRFDWFYPNGTLNLRMADTFGELPLDVALDPDGNAYWPTFSAIRVFDTSGRFLKNFPRFVAVNPSVITFDLEGNAYTNARSDGPPGNLSKSTPAGDWIATFAVPADGNTGGAPTSLDLASDQCTMYYTCQGTRVFRYDVCRGVVLPDLTSAILGSRAGRLRLVPDGSVLVVNRLSVLRLNDAGAVIRTYDVAGEDLWRALALDIDGSSFWATSRNTAFKFDIATGALLDTFQSSDYYFNAITVVGEPRVATTTPRVIPALSPWSLIALALCLATVAVVRLHVVR